MNLLTIILLINIASFIYCAAFYPPNFFLKGPTAKATIYGVDGSKISSEADAGSISSDGITGATFKGSTVGGNSNIDGSSSFEQPKHSCANCASDSSSLLSDSTKYNPAIAQNPLENTHSSPYPGGSHVVIQGPSMTSTINGPTSNSDSSHYPTHHQTGSVEHFQKSTNCDNEGSDSSNLLVSPIGTQHPHSGSSPNIGPLSNTNSGSYNSPNHGSYGTDQQPHNHHPAESEVHIQGPSVSSSIGGPQSHTDSGSSNSKDYLSTNHGSYGSPSSGLETYEQPHNQHSGASEVHIESPSVSSSITGPQSHTDSGSSSSTNHGSYGSPSSGLETYEQPHNQHSGASDVHREGPSMSSSITGPQSHTDSGSSGSTNHGSYGSPSSGPATYEVPHNQHPGESEVHIQGPSVSSSIIGPHGLPSAGLSAHEQTHNQHPGQPEVHIQGPSMSSSITGPQSHTDSGSSGSTNHGSYGSASSGPASYDVLHNQHPGGSEVHIQGPSVSSSIIGPHGLPSVGLSAHEQTHNQHPGQPEVHIQGPSVSSSIIGSHGLPSAGLSTHEQTHNQHPSEYEVHIMGPSMSSTISGPQYHTDSGSSSPKNYLSTNHGSYGSPLAGLGTYEQPHGQYSKDSEVHILGPSMSSSITGPQSNGGSNSYGTGLPSSSIIFPESRLSGQDYSESGSSIIPQHTANSVPSSNLNTVHSDENHETVHLVPGRNGFITSSSYTSYSPGQSQDGTGVVVPHTSYTDNRGSNGEYYESSSFAPATYTSADSVSSNLVGNDVIPPGSSGQHNYNKDYDCYVIKFPISTYAYVVPSEYSAFLKRLAESAPVKPEIYHHKHLHHSHY